MTADSSGRTTTAFTVYTYSPDAESLRVKNVDASQVDGRTVVFV